MNNNAITVTVEEMDLWCVKRLKFSKHQFIEYLKDECIVRNIDFDRIQHFIISEDAEKKYYEEAKLVKEALRMLKVKKKFRFFYK